MPTAKYVGITSNTFYVGFKKNYRLTLIHL